jgi:hypothetical protein
MPQEKENICIAGHSGCIYNPNYSGGRDQEDGGSRPACRCGVELQDPISINKKLNSGMCLSSELHKKHE